jgi:hypothetical protein
MNPTTPNLPQSRPLEVNDIDHTIRCYGGRTIATDMEPIRMQHSKRPEDLTQYIDFLNRRNGELRLEATFYRECFTSTKKFEAKIVKISQDLLHECIIGLLDDTALDEIRNISKSIVDALEELSREEKEAFDAFIAPYKGCRTAMRPNMSATGTNGWI